VGPLLDAQKLGVVGGWVVVVAYRILVSAPVPFGFNWGWNWVGTELGLGLRGLGTRGTRVWD